MDEGASVQHGQEGRERVAQRAGNSDTGEVHDAHPHSEEEEDPHVHDYGEKDGSVIQRDPRRCRCATGTERHEGVRRREGRAW